jgi:hypothetical protein
VRLLPLALTLPLDIRSTDHPSDMANPFETFAYRQTAPAVAAAKGSTPQKVAAPDRPPNRSPSRQPTQPPMPSDSDIKQQQAVSPVAQTTDLAAVRSSSRVKQSRSTALSPGAAKKRKAYASLTGPPKGLGPKLGTSPLRLILVSMLLALELAYMSPGWQVTLRPIFLAGGTQPFRACISHRTLLQQPVKQVRQQAFFPG